MKAVSYKTAVAAPRNFVHHKEAHELMSNIRSLRKAFPGTPWKVAFAEALICLDPAMNPDAADEASDTAFGQHEHMSPPEAALAWWEAGRNLPSLVAAPGRATDSRAAAN